MADRSACHGRILIIGHSFVRRLRDWFDGKEVEVCGHRVTFCGWGGATVKTLRDKLAGTDVANFCMVYVEIGSNDLCSEPGDIVASSLWALVAYLRTHGAAQVIFGQVLFRTRRWAGGPSVEQLNDRMRDWMGERKDTYYWRHWGLHNPRHLAHDGVHINARFMATYWRSVRGALIKNMHR